MKKIMFLSTLAGVCFALVVTSCSNDVVSNEGDAGIPVTKAPAGAYPIKTMGVTVGQNTEQFTFTYNATNEITGFSSVKGTVTKTATVSYATAGKVIVVCNDPNMGEAMRYTYTLNADGYVTEAEEAYDSDGYLNGKMKFLYDASKRLTDIQLGEEDANGNWVYSSIVTFSYSGKSKNYDKITEEGTSVSTAYVTNWPNKASFDLNLLSLFGIGSTLGDCFTYAVFADLFPNTTLLLSEAKVDNNNLTIFAYNLYGDKTNACDITYKAENTNEDTGVTEVVTSTTYVTFGY